MIWLVVALLFQPPRPGRFIANDPSRGSTAYFGTAPGSAKGVRYTDGLAVGNTRIGCTGVETRCPAHTRVLPRNRSNSLARAVLESTGLHELYQRFVLISTVFSPIRE